MPIGKPWSKGSGKPLMTVQQLAAETGEDRLSLAQKLRKSEDRPTPINKSSHAKHGGENSTYYDPDELRNWWKNYQKAHPSPALPQQGEGEQ